MGTLACSAAAAAPTSATSPRSPQRTELADWIRPAHLVDRSELERPAGKEAATRGSIPHCWRDVALCGERREFRSVVAQNGSRGLAGALGSWSPVTTRARLSR